MCFMFVLKKFCCHSYYNQCVIYRIISGLGLERIVAFNYHKNAPEASGMQSCAELHEASLWNTVSQ